MANKNRTQIEDIAVESQELTTAEAGNVKGGVTTTATPPPPPPPTTTTGTTNPQIKAGYDLKQNKAA